MTSTILSVEVIKVSFRLRTTDFTCSAMNTFNIVRLRQFKDKLLKIASESSLLKRKGFVLILFSESSKNCNIASYARAQRKLAEKLNFNSLTKN